MTEILCSTCSIQYPEKNLPYCCPRCGGIFDIKNITTSGSDYSLEPQPGIWKHRSTFPLGRKAPIAYLGEGDTPLIERELNHHQVYFKLEGLNPSGSYKDRGTAVLIGAILERSIREVAEDSSGNAGASLAAYCGAFGIKANIFIPEGTSGPKRSQIEAYGASVTPVPGSREKASEAALEVIHRKKMPYASHAYQPFGLTGTATIAYELLSQSRQVPRTIITPVGQGGLLLGLVLGFNFLRNQKMIENLPIMVGVQPEGYAPFVARWYKQDYQPTNQPTLAEGTKINHPVRIERILTALQPGDKWLAISEPEIRQAYIDLANMGIFVEPTSAMVWAGYKRLSGQIDDPVVLILSGFGLKSNMKI